MSQEQEPSRAHSMMQYVLDNKLKTILSCWAGGITLSMVSPCRRRCIAWIPPTLRRPLASPASKSQQPSCPAPPSNSRLKAYEWSRPIPSQLKVIHSRVYAQVTGGGRLSGEEGGAA